MFLDRACAHLTDNLSTFLSRRGSSSRSSRLTLAHTCPLAACHTRPVTKVKRLPKVFDSDENFYLRGSQTRTAATGAIQDSCRAQWANQAPSQATGVCQAVSCLLMLYSASSIGREACPSLCLVSLLPKANRRIIT